IVDVAVGAVLTGMEGRSVLVVASEDQATTLASCVVDGSAACAFVIPLLDGEHELDAVGSDAAGNPLVNDTLSLRVDSNGPCVATIAVGADANSDGFLNADEGASTDVIVTFTS